MKFKVKLINAIFYLYKTCLSPFLGENCRFHPTCSEYCREALTELPIARALPLITKRILSCNPWNRRCGFDPVPKSD